MSRTTYAVDDLVAGLRGGPINVRDWAAVLEFANKTLLTPALYASLLRAGTIGSVPDDVRAYLEFIHSRNRERNLRLRSQLIEAVGGLNRLGIRPMLLKGAVLLFLDPGERIGSRITSDLDLAVAPADEPVARECLLRLGYRDLPDVRGMGRPQDVGMVELRHAPLERICAAEIMAAHGVEARVPSPTALALHWLVHDLVKEGDYWRGRLDLRHLHDLAELAAKEPIDWEAARSAMPGRSGRNALDTQLLALSLLFGVSVVQRKGPSPLTRFHHWRRLMGARHPIRGWPLRIAGNLAWGGKRFLDILASGQMSPGDFTRRAARTLALSRAGPKL